MVSELRRKLENELSQTEGRIRLLATRLNAGELGAALIHSLDYETGLARRLQARLGLLKAVEVLTIASCLDDVTVQPDGTRVLQFLRADGHYVSLSIDAEGAIAVDDFAPSSKMFVPAAAAPTTHNSIAEDAFYERLRVRNLRHNQHFELLPWQKGVVHTIFSQGPGAGKTFLINLLKELDR